MAPTPNQAPSTHRLARWLRGLRLSLRRNRCKAGHKPRTANLRERGSRFGVELTSCMRCDAVLEVRGHRLWRSNR